MSVAGCVQNAMGWRTVNASAWLDVICIDPHPVGPEGSRDDEETKRVAVGEQTLETGRQGDSFCVGNEFHVRGRRGSARDADFRAHHQRDLGEAPESHGGSGKSVDGTTASPGQTRFGAMRKRLWTAEPRESLASTRFGRPSLAPSMATTDSSMRKRQRWFTGSFQIMGFQTATNERPYTSWNCWLREAVLSSMKRTRRSQTPSRALLRVKRATTIWRSGFGNA